MGRTVLAKPASVILWYAKNIERARSKFHNPTAPKIGGSEDGSGQYTFIEPTDYSETPRPMTTEELEGSQPIPHGWQVLAHDTLYSQGAPSDPDETTFVWNGQTFRCPPNTHWKPGVKTGGMGKLAGASRLVLIGNTLRYKRYVNDFPVYLIDNVWNDTAISGFARKKEYVVETSPKVAARCLLMTTDPGDLVLDPTCGSGTTAYVAEQWGRRWITIDTSRVPLALARQRLLTATFPWYELKDNGRGPAAGFVYERKQNKKGEEVGGIVPHVTLKSIANNEPPEEEVLVDRPESDNKVTRVTGAFCVEGTIPTPVNLAASEQAIKDSSIGDLKDETSTFTDRMIEILRQSPVLRLEGNRPLTLKSIRPPAKTLSLSAEAFVEATAPGQAPTLQDAVQEAVEKNGKMLSLSSRPVALVFGPENGAIAERLVHEAAREAQAKSYTHLYVIGFAIQPNARQLIDNCEAVMDIPATYIQATPDLLMGDLLKNMRSSQIFSVCGLPEIKVQAVEPGLSPALAGPKAGPGSIGAVSPALGSAALKGGATGASAALKGGATTSPTKYQVELLGLDVFDPVTMEPDHRKGNDVPAWFLDTDYNGLCSHVSQAFFPRTSAWENLKKALKGDYEESVWDHLAGTTSAPFAAGEHRQIAVKVIDDRGNELMVVERLP